MYDKISLAVTGLALVKSIIGVAIPYWYYFSITVEGVHVSSNFGLWKTCATAPTIGGSDVTICLTFDEFEGFHVPAEFQAARALEILGILATAAALVIICAKMFFMKENNRLLYIATPIPLIAGMLMIIGAIVFVVNNEAKKVLESADPQIHLKPHAGFGLCIVAGIFNLAASPLIFLAGRAIPGLR